MEGFDTNENPEVPTTAEKRYATREETLTPDLAKPRFKDVYVEQLGCYFHIRNLDDREWSRLTSLPMKSNGQLDKIEAQAADVRMIVACCVDPETKKPIYNDQDIKAIRQWDAAITIKLATEIRNHIGVPEEGEAKK